MIYRGPGLLAAAWFGSPITPFLFSREQLVSLSQSSCVLLVELTDGCGGGARGGGGAKWYGRKKAWPSINHSILSGLHYCLPPLKIFFFKASLIFLFKKHGHAGVLKLTVNSTVLRWPHLSSITIRFLYLLLPLDFLYLLRFGVVLQSVIIVTGDYSIIYFFLPQPMKMQITFIR
jgi:hypothetical protein